MQKYFAVIAFISTGALAACGGGGSSSGGGSVTPTMPTSPVSTTAPASQGNLPATDMVKGAPALVDPASHKTLYFLDVDTPTGGTCTDGCLSIWPIFAPNAQAQASGSITIITRSDGNGRQFASQNHPLYTFTGDSGPDQAFGDNFPEFGGHWHIARPAAAALSSTPAPTPAPTATPMPGSGGPY